MIITDTFVMINFPKTGSSFARLAINRIYEQRRKSPVSRILALAGFNRKGSCIELMLPQSEFSNHVNVPRHQHGRREQVPREYSHLPVLSIARDPVDRNISNYEFRWWADHPIAHVDVIRQRFPGFPDLSFTEYLDYQNFNTQFRDTGIDIADDIGNQTVQFIQFFFNNPKEAFRMLNDDYIYSGAYRQDLPDLTLLSTENLNRELYNFLLQNGFSEKEINFVLEEERLRPGSTQRKDDETRKNYLTNNILKEIRYKERYLYRIYRDFGIDYENSGSNAS